jgi:hypothetical protein
VVGDCVRVEPRLDDVLHLAGDTLIPDDAGALGELERECRYSCGE